jgi:hypothetical protein
MGWILFDQRVRENEFFLTIGKTLVLCQHFESACKNIVMWLCLAKSLHEEKFEFLSDGHKDYVEKLLNLFLGRSIEELKNKMPDIASPEDFQILKEAKDSRNYFCHESSLGLIYAPYGNIYELNPDLTLINEHVGKLAMGDYLVSKWAYEFHEKESGAFKNRDQYISSIKGWILNQLTNASE